MSTQELLFVAGICLLCLAIIWRIGYLTYKKDLKDGRIDTKWSDTTGRGVTCEFEDQSDGTQSVYQQDISLETSSDKLSEGTKLQSANSGKGSGIRSRQQVLQRS